jgi:hypothetical protein
MFEINAEGKKCPSTFQLKRARVHFGVKEKETVVRGAGIA